MPSHITSETSEMITDSWLMRCVNDLPSLEILSFINLICRVTTSDSKWLPDLQDQRLLCCCCHVTLNCVYSFSLTTLFPLKKHFFLPGYYYLKHALCRFYKKAIITRDLDECQHFIKAANVIVNVFLLIL